MAASKPKKVINWMDGWISLYRQIQTSWLWEDKPFTRGQAWIDMLLSANHKDSKIPFDGKLHEVKRGSFITSIRKLCERWGWSNTKVKSFLDLCVEEGMIRYQSDTKKTVITIENYSVYQLSNDTKTTLEHHRNITETSQKHTNNNDNNNTFVVVEGEEIAAVAVDNVENIDKLYKNLCNYFNNNIHLMTPVEFQKLQFWIEEGMNEDVILFAIEEAVNQGKRTMAYIEGILKNYMAMGVKTRADAENLKRQWQEQKNKPKAANKNENQKKNSFNNFRGRQDDDPDYAKKIEEGLRRKMQQEMQKSNAL